MDRIEQLRDKLNLAIENGMTDEILNLSRRLDAEILRYIKTKSIVSSRSFKLRARKMKGNMRRETRM